MAVCFYYQDWAEGVDCGMPQCRLWNNGSSTALLQEFVKSLVKQGFKLNLYDGCVANKIVKGKQITMCFHVDDCKLSHEHSKVVDETIKWLRAEYESILEDGLGAMKDHRGKVHKYLGMTLDFSHKG